MFLKNHKGKEFVREYVDVLESIERITKQQDYFLIHGDYLFSNIIYNTDLTVIDFDDCEYGYYQYDIAVYMFYYLLGGNPLEMNLSVNKKRFELFMNGYRSIRKIDYIELEDLNPFFRLRQMKLLGTITEYQGDDMGEWQKKFVDSSIKRIREGKNFI
ncbi:MAG: phosphotransferase enzyme family protein [Candidatus Izemoplasmataceae bacterium]